MTEYTGTAIDPELFATGQSSESTEAEGTVDQAEPAETGGVQDTPTTTDGGIEIEGIGKVRPEEIRAWKDGHMMRSDYTKKTQELAEQRKEMQLALDVYSRIQSNPELINTLQQAEGKLGRPLPYEMTPQGKMLQQMALRQEGLELDLKLERLHAKYGEFSEAELLRHATELKTKDLETVLKAQLYEKRPADGAAVAAAKQQLKEEREATRFATSTIAGKGTGGIQKQTGASALSAEERSIAIKMGMKPEEYAKWK